MRLLLTSAGVRNPTIHAALLELLGKPIEECSALLIPTAGYGHPMAGPGNGAWRFMAGTSEQPMAELGWASLGVLELTALPSIPRENWEPLVRRTDVLLANGGDALYLAHWMRESGLADLLPELDAVWVGFSAGSMVMAPRIGEEFRGWVPPADHGAADRALGVVDFSIFPHLDHPMCPENTLDAAEQWAATLGTPCYALDDECAVVVDGDRVEVVGEGPWHAFSSA